MTAASADLIVAAALALVWIALLRGNRQWLAAGAYYGAATFALLGLTSG